MTGPDLKAALKDLGLKQVPFGRLIDVHQQTVSRWCRGVLEIPLYVEVIIGLMRENRRLRSGR